MLENHEKDTLSKEDLALIDIVRAKLDNQHYQEALSLIYERLHKGIDVSTAAGAIFKSNLATLLIDIGSEESNEATIQDGLRILENERPQLTHILSDHAQSDHAQ